MAGSTSANAELNNYQGTLININALMKIIQQIPSWLKNKYLLTGAFFLVWMLFFDPRDIFYNISLTKKDKELQKSEKHLYQNIAETKKEASLLKTNTQTIEKYARENFYMKKENEELFIIKSDTDRK